MIIVFQPGGTIRDARIVLKFDEKLPNHFNVPESIVYRELETNPREWQLIKDRHVTLPSDSPLLSHPPLPPVDSFPLTNEVKDATFEHVDIIRFEEGT